MAISIDWSTKVISVPKDYMTLVQSSPTEIRELSIDQFRLDLKDLEDNVDGIVNPDTHRHYPAITVGGVELAMVIEIITTRLRTLFRHTFFQAVFQIISICVMPLKRLPGSFRKSFLLGIQWPEVP